MGTSSLSGRVTTAGGAGIGGIRVFVQQLVNGSRFGGLQADTNPDGSWSLDGLGDATYIVSFFDGSETYRNGWYNAGALVIGSENASPVAIAGSSVGNIDVTPPVEAPLILSGTVADPAAVGVQGVTVNATDVDFGISGCSETAPAGDWAMRIRTGRYLISISDPSGTYLSGYYDASNPPSNFSLANADATRLDLTGDLGGIDLRFPVTYTLEGTVTNGVTPVEGLSVAGCVDGGQCVVYDDTDASGQYILPMVADGDWTIQIGDGSNTYRGGYRGVGDGVVANLAEAAITTVSGANVTGVDVTTFRNATMAGTVTDARGAPLAGVDVQVCDLEQLNCGVGATDPAGEYTTGGLPPNSYTVLVSDATGNHPSGYLAAGNGFSQLPSDAATLAVGDPDVTGVDVQIPDGYRISGTLQVNGTPADGRSVGVCPIEDWCVTEASTDVDGSFVTPAVLPGTYRLQTFTNDRVFYRNGADATPTFGDGSPVEVLDADVTGIAFQATEATGDPTDEGFGVMVPLTDPSTGQSPVILTFDEVTSGGLTTLTVSAQGPDAPAGFQLGDPPTYFEIETTATFTGQVEVCIYYGGLVLSDDSNFRLLHYDATADPPWKDVTTSLDVDGDVICGLTNSFSPFAIATRVPVFGGFESPVDDRPVTNKAKAGSAIPVTFSLGGDFGLDIFAAESPGSVRTDCDGGVADAIEVTVAPGSSTLTYDPLTGTYTYVWKTSKAWASTCRTLVLEFADGSTAEADFRFVK